MKKIVLFLAIAFAYQLSTVQAQEFKKPSEGKAVVYFLRTSGLGAAVNFKFFDDDKYLGKFSGKNYARYELEPGKHLLFVKSENLEFMEADVKAGGVYLVQVKPKMGGFKAAVRLEVISGKDQKVLEKAKKLVTKKKPVTFNTKKAEKEIAKIADYMAKYEKIKGTDKVKILSSDMEFMN